jgi:hypothetical protein
MTVWPSCEATVEGQRVQAVAGDDGGRDDEAVVGRGPDLLDPFVSQPAPRTVLHYERYGL